MKRAPPEIRRRFLFVKAVNFSMQEAAENVIFSMENARMFRKTGMAWQLKKPD